MLDPIPATSNPAHSPTKPKGSAMISRPAEATTVDRINAARGDRPRKARSAGICRRPIVPE